VKKVKDMKYHWFDEPDSIHIQLTEEMRNGIISKAVKSAGGIYNLARILQISPKLCIFWPSRKENKNVGKKRNK
jgi:hypothetical protein